jgi:zinc transport system substrate-binding protein
LDPLCRYGLTQVPIEGLTPIPSPPRPGLAEIIDFVKEHQVSTIFFEELVSPKVAETIAAATGAVTEVLTR